MAKKINSIQQKQPNSMAVILKQFNLVLEVKKMLRAKEIVFSEAAKTSWWGGPTLVKLELEIL